MTYDELCDLWEPVATKFCLVRLYPEVSIADDPRGTWKYYQLDDLLDVHEYEFNYFKTGSPRPQQPMCPYLKNLLIGLKGPYGHAILKVYLIQKGLPHD